MKLLIAISSCYDFEKNGSNQALRDTWLKDAERLGIPYKFFFGVGQGAEKFLTTTDAGFQFSENCVALEMVGDFVVLPRVPDDYGHVTYKTRESLAFAHELGFDFVLRAFPDSYIHMDRMMACPFADFDYYGDFRSEEGGRTDGGTGVFRPTLQQAQNYASGGAGYWLSRRAFELLLDAPVTGVWRDDITPYAEDLWVGNRLGKCGVELRYFDDIRFCNHGSYCWPNAGNDLITAHMSCPDRYQKAWMYAAHQARDLKLNLEELAELRQACADKYS